MVQYGFVYSTNDSHIYRCSLYFMSSKVIDLFEAVTFIGCKVTEKDSLKISNGALILIRDDMYRNLYLLKRTTVLEESCVEVNSSCVLNVIGL